MREVIQRFVESPYRKSRKGHAIDSIIIHSISLPPGKFGTGHVEALFTGRLDPSWHPEYRELAGKELSTHYFIDRRGIITQFVKPEDAAFHAGESELEGKRDCNLFSIGIELEGDFIHPFTEDQYRALAGLCFYLMKNFPAIVPRRITGHKDIAPVRKSDPGPTFQWDKFFEYLRELRRQETSLECKIGQMIMAGLVDQREIPLFESLCRRGIPGFVLLFEESTASAESARSLSLNLLRCRPQTMLPVMLAVDHEGGTVQRIKSGMTPLPSAKEMGENGDPSFIRTISETAASELAAAGIFLNLAPVADVLGHSPCPAIEQRAFGNDHRLVADMVQAYIDGAVRTVATCAKHFPGHGFVDSDSHLQLPVDRRAAADVLGPTLAPFRTAAAASPAIMTAHILYPHLDSIFPATLSRKIIADILRGELAYSGVVITDDLEMAAITSKWDVKEAAILAIEAGCDIITISRRFGKTDVESISRAVLKAVEKGRITAERIDASFMRVLKLKDRYAGPPIDSTT